MLTLPVGTQARPHRTAASAQQLEIAHQQAKLQQQAQMIWIRKKGPQTTSQLRTLHEEFCQGSGEGTVIGHVRCDVTVRNQGLDGAELTFSSLALIRVSAHL